MKFKTRIFRSSRKKKYALEKKSDHLPIASLMSYRGGMSNATGYTFPFQPRLFHASAIQNGHQLNFMPRSFPQPPAYDQGRDVPVPAHVVQQNKRPRGDASGPGEVPVSQPGRKRHKYEKDALAIMTEEEKKKYYGLKTDKAQKLFAKKINEERKVNNKKQKGPVDNNPNNLWDFIVHAEIKLVHCGVLVFDQKTEITENTGFDCDTGIFHLVFIFMRGLAEHGIQNTGTKTVL
jgi:hypothetical protein